MPMLDGILHDCVDMEAFTEATVCREMGIRFISLKLVSDSFNVSLNQWQASLSEVVHRLVNAIETLKRNSIIA
jgi:nucleoside phosphorylase